MVASYDGRNIGYFFSKKIFTDNATAKIWVLNVMFSHASDYLLGHL